jgi:hypothetical protein
MSEWNVPKWLETELARHITGARAPEELWHRIQHPRATQRASANAWMRWPVAAMLIAGALWLPGKVPMPRIHTTALVTRVGDQNPDRCPLQCGPPLIDPVYQVAEDWVRRMPTYAVVPASAPHEASGCTACHVATN